MTVYTICLLDAGEYEPTEDITTDGKIVGYVMYEQHKTATYKDFR